MVWNRVTSLVLGSLLCPILLVAAQDAATASSGKTTTYRLTGVVLDTGRVPIPEAEVALIAGGEVQRHVRTGGDGRFALGDYSASLVVVQVRRVGYEQRKVDVQLGAGGQPSSIEIVLTALPVQLEEVFVNASEYGRLREFYARKQQRHTFARFLDADEISRIAPSSPSELFRSVPGITISVSSSGGNSIRIRGCQPMVWVDGQRIPGAELDDVVQSTEIGGIEFYASAAGIPAQYMDPSNRLCGLILVWTRSQ
jgi:Carboxypeptidase regulatory-like domain/TonB-dependent Receptor Plug Domain